MDKEELKKEEEYLKGVIDALDTQLEFLNNSLYEQEKNLDQTSKYMASAYYDMDAEEQAVAKQNMEQLQLGIIALTNTRNLKEHQRKSPYFGRIDFWAKDEPLVLPYYIGIAHIADTKLPIPLVLDWRAPLCSMYYDYEPGPAKYIAPIGEIAGKIYLKRQYKTQGNNLVYAFDSSLTIGDEILKDILGQNANAKMKNIVATIQAEQNKIIRASAGKNIIVQGVAGSGKTSIALHRVAYLLYTNHIKAADILIVSPSSLFSDYISDVLPELGESNTPKITFEEIAQNELGGLVRFEPKSQMLEDIISGKNKLRTQNVQTKSTYVFFEALKTFLAQKVVVNFVAKDIKVGKTVIKAAEIQKLYSENYQRKTPAVRVEWIADFVVDKLGIEGKNQQAVFDRVKRVLFTMFKNTNIVGIYEDFLATQNMALDKAVVDKQIFVGYEDVPAILYIKSFLLGTQVHKHFKHVIIDEMQDYSPIAMEILNTIYPATKTILGDENQTIEKTLDKNYLKSLSAQLDAKLFVLSTTYRSTKQIAKYSQKIGGIKGAKMFNRDGRDVFLAKGLDTLPNILRWLCDEFESVALICPSIASAKHCFDLVPKELNFDFVGESSGQAKGGNVVIPTAFCKGLEFDAVVFVDEGVGRKIDKNIKYVACTRALHSLTVVEM